MFVYLMTIVYNIEALSNSDPRTKSKKVYLLFLLIRISFQM